MVEPRYSLAPQVINIGFGVEPVFNALESLSLLTQVDTLSGLGDWVTTTAAALPPERLRFQGILFSIMGDLFSNIAPPNRQQRDFPAYAKHLDTLNPEQVVWRIVEALRALPQYHPEMNLSLAEVPTAETLLRNREVFVQFAQKAETHCFDADTLNEAHRLFNDPAALLGSISEHLLWMWGETLAAEWERVRPMIEESVAAYERLEFHNLTGLEAIRAVTGRDMTGKMGSKLETSDLLLFMPNAHIGPYISKWKFHDSLLLAFGARLPRGVQTHSSALSRSELLVRLNALADDTRLRILELLTQHEELCAQDIIERLGLSQSTISRHLSQLSASGYITERRREVAKCYSLNTDRVVDTVRSLTNFLSRQ